MQTKSTAMTTKLDKPLCRELEIDEPACALRIDAVGVRFVEKGRRSGQTLEWRALVRGDAVLAAGLGASLQAATGRR